LSGYTRSDLLSVWWFLILEPKEADIWKLKFES